MEYHRSATENLQKWITKSNDGPQAERKNQKKRRKNSHYDFFSNYLEIFPFFNEMKCRRRRITSRRLFGNKSGDDGSRSGVTGDTANSCGGGCSPRAIGPRRPLAIVPFQRRLRFLNPLGWVWSVTDKPLLTSSFSTRLCIALKITALSRVDSTLWPPLSPHLPPHFLSSLSLPLSISSRSSDGAVATWWFIGISCQFHSPLFSRGSRNQTWHSSLNQVVSRRHDSGESVISFSCQDSLRPCLGFPRNIIFIVQSWFFPMNLISGAWCSAMASGLSLRCKRIPWILIPSGIWWDYRETFLIFAS